MPWQPKDARRHDKAATGKKGRQWAHMANGVLQRTGNEGLAVREANGVVKHEKHGSHHEHHGKHHKGGRPKVPHAGEGKHPQGEHHKAHHRAPTNHEEFMKLGHHHKDGI